MDGRACESSISLPGVAGDRAVELTISLLGRIFSNYGPVDYTVRLWNGAAIPPGTGQSRFIECIFPRR